MFILMHFSSRHLQARPTAQAQDEIRAKQVKASIHPFTFCKCWSCSNTQGAAAYSAPQAWTGLLQPALLDLLVML